MQYVALYKNLSNHRLHIYESPSHVGAETPAPCTSTAIQTGKVVREGGRNRVTLNYESEAGSRVVYDRVRDYTYSFHPAGVVHLYPLGLQAGS